MRKESPVPKEVEFPETDSDHCPGALEDMASQAQELANAVVGHQIIRVELAPSNKFRGGNGGVVLTLDTGKKVRLLTASDCCANSELRAFIYSAPEVPHVITSVATSDDFDKWHILAGMYQVLGLDLDWSEGNYPFYCFGFDIEVVSAT